MLFAILIPFSNKDQSLWRYTPSISANIDSLFNRVINFEITKEKDKLGKIHHKCFYCKKKLQTGKKTHLEHVIPFDSGVDNVKNPIFQPLK